MEPQEQAAPKQEQASTAKNNKSAATINSLFIGFLAGIVVFSVAKSSWGFLTLIPLFMIYKLINKPKVKG